MFQPATTTTPQSVSTLVAALKGVVEPAFRQVWVQGELSGVKHHPSGHCIVVPKN
ncbi:hypothetical protein TPY_3128 [Sulfobacillus acidophilus TPY]|nr:hypothetical protein TPY_3128 [Sulfobacillus acidophilus TPY]